MRLSTALPLAFVMTAQAAQAGLVQGPTVTAQATAPARIEPAVGTPGDVKVQSTRYEANLVVPVGLPTDAGTIVVLSMLVQEKRVYSGPDTAASPAGFANPSVAGIDALYLLPARDGAPQLFGGGGRYGPLRLARTGRPMWEALAGAGWSKAAVPAALTPGAGDEVTLTALVRLRRYPGFDRWLYLAGYDLKRASGWLAEVEVPSHVTAGWEAPDGRWRAEAGIRWQSREYPVGDGNVAGWLDGYATTYLARVRRELAKPLYLALEAGLATELLRFADERGVTLESHQTRVAPWVKVALETWVKAP